MPVIYSGYLKSGHITLSIWEPRTIDCGDAEGLRARARAARPYWPKPTLRAGSLRYILPAPRPGCPGLDVTPMSRQTIAEKQDAVDRVTVRRLQLLRGPMVQAAALYTRLVAAGMAVSAAHAVLPSGTRVVVTGSAFLDAWLSFVVYGEGEETIRRAIRATLSSHGFDVRE